MDKPRITEIKVRMDCNGCVQKIKKALQGITGIYDLYIDFPQQKLTIIGCADPVMIVKAIKKTRKSAVICSHMDQPEQPTEHANEGYTPEGGAPPAEPPAEQAQTEAAPPVEEKLHDSPPSQAKPPSESANATSQQPTQPSKPKDAEEIHVVYRYPPEYGYRFGQNFQQSNGPGFRNEPFQPYTRGPGYGHPGLGPEPFQPYARGPGYSHLGLGPEPFQPYARGPGYGHPGFGPEPFQPYTRSMGYSYEPSQSYIRAPGFVGETSQHYNRGPGNRDEPSQAHTTRPGLGDEPSQPTYVTHSYNTYKPSPYVTEYAYPRSPPRYSHYSTPDHYSQDYYYRGNNSNGNGNITSMFSEENPNACRIA